MIATMGSATVESTWERSVAVTHKKTAPGGTPALTLLDRTGTAHTVHAYEHDPATPLGYGAEAAAVLGIDPERVYKTLIAKVDGRLVVGVVPVSGKLDLRLLARAVGGKKAALADPAEAERATGYVVGGISPLGQRLVHPTVLDSSVFTHQHVVVSAGRRGLDIGLAPQDLVSLTSALIAEIARA